jgi:hypothetical protein
VDLELELVFNPYLLPGTNLPVLLLFLNKCHCCLLNQIPVRAEASWLAFSAWHSTWHAVANTHLKREIKQVAQTIQVVNDRPKI